MEALRTALQNRKAALKEKSREQAPALTLFGHPVGTISFSPGRHEEPSGWKNAENPTSSPPSQVSASTWATSGQPVEENRRVFYERRSEPYPIDGCCGSSDRTHVVTPASSPSNQVRASTQLPGSPTPSERRMMVLDEAHKKTVKESKEWQERQAKREQEDDDDDETDTNDSLSMQEALVMNEPPVYHHCTL